LYSECTFKPQTSDLPDMYKDTKKKNEKHPLTEEYVKIINDPENKGGHKGISLYKLAQPVREKKELLAKEREEKDLAKSRSECLFRPTIEVRFVPDSIEDHHGIDKAIERMTKGRKDKLEFKKATERGFNEENLPDLKFGLDVKSEKKKVMNNKYKDIRDEVKEAKFKEWEQKKIKEKREKETKERAE